MTVSMQILGSPAWTRGGLEGTNRDWLSGLFNTKAAGSGGLNEREMAGIYHFSLQHLPKIITSLALRGIY